MTRDELIETMARAICRASGYEPDLAEHETLPNNESIDGWKNWFGFKPEARAALAAIETAGLAIVPVEATGAIEDAILETGHVEEGTYGKSSADCARTVYRAMIYALQI